MKFKSSFKRRKGTRISAIAGIKKLQEKSKYSSSGIWGSRPNITFANPNHFLMTQFEYDGNLIDR